MPRDTAFRGATEFQHCLLEEIARGNPFALACVLKSEGSTPQKIGVKAVIDECGAIRGTLGGGLLEATAIRHAIEACRSMRPLVFDFQMNDSYNRSAGPICGGNMRILIDPTISERREVHEQVLETLEQRGKGTLLTIIYHCELPVVKQEWIPRKMTEPNEKPLSLHHSIRQSTEHGALCESLVEPLNPSPLLIIVGAGHVGQALAVLAVWNGFEVRVIDDRLEFTDPSLFPTEVEVRCEDPSKALRGMDLDEDTYVALVNRGHRQDAESLEACIHSRVRYIGMIGSERKVALMRKSFVSEGIATEEEYRMVHAPIGIEIGAETVPEIATSIMAELIAVRRLGSQLCPR